MREMLDALAKGDEPAVWDVDSDTPFYVLGLSPNASRLAVRFWHQSTVDEISRRLADHFNDLRIDRRYDREPEYPGQWRLLIQTASQGKSENISPVLGGELTYSILTGADYPRTILSRVIGRIRAEQEVTTFRAALIKAYYARILRKGRSTKDISKAEVQVSLNEKSTNIGYRLGRLFAVLEKAQRDALGQNINATIKDRFFGAASATPASVFPRLIRLAQHHISKAEYGGVSDRRMAEIMEGVDEFPKHLDLDGQAMFALGYYHQRNALYAKKTEEQAEAAQA
jgi:CRISPR-associated protein Csd1